MGNVNQQPSPLTHDAAWENAMTLAAAIGLDAEAASKMLDGCVILTLSDADSTALCLASDSKRLLERTISDVIVNVIRDVSSADATSGDGNAVPAIGKNEHSGRGPGPRVEVVLGNAMPVTPARVVRVTMDSEGLTINSRIAPAAGCAPIHPLLIRLSACYVAAFALQRFLGDQAFVELPDPLHIFFAELGVTAKQLQEPLEIGHAYMAGAGAIGNG